MGGCFSKNWKLLPQPQLVVFTISIPVEGKGQARPCYVQIMGMGTHWLGLQSLSKMTLMFYLLDHYCWWDVEDKTEHKNKLTLAGIRVWVKILGASVLINCQTNPCNRTQFSRTPSPGTYRSTVLVKVIPNILWNSPSILYSLHNA